MAPRPLARKGTEFQVNHSPVDFSMHMVHKTTRHWTTRPQLYASDPWSVVEGALPSAANLSAAERSAGRSFIRQSREFFDAAQRTSVVESEPLLYYYSFLNLAKSVAMVRGQGDMSGSVVHGIRQRGSSSSADSAVVKVDASPRPNGQRKSAVHELHTALNGAHLVEENINVSTLMSQSLLGHRLWNAAQGRSAELFLGLDTIEILIDDDAKYAWALLRIDRGKFNKFKKGRSQDEVFRLTGLSDSFTPVRAEDEGTNAHSILLESTTPTAYINQPGEAVVKIVEQLKPILWQTVIPQSPYRRFYVYVCPPEQTRYPQWFTVYLLMFWLGSLTRYHPQDLLKLMEGKYGPFLREFLQIQPRQLLYLLASDAVERSVAGATVV